MKSTKNYVALEKGLIAIKIMKIIIKFNEIIHVLFV